MKKLWKFLGSMRFAILLLAVLILACAGGSFITQGLSFEEYAQRYSQRGAALILALGLEDVFHSWWFITIAAFLCGNLLLCNLIRLPQLLRRTAEAADPAKAGSPDLTLEGVEDPEELLRRLHMPKARQSLDPQGRPLRFSVQNRAGLWGAWVCHLGILLLILGFGLGQMTKEEYSVYGVPGQTKQIGETDYALSIRDFRVDRREDGSVEQYQAELTVCDLSDPEDVLAQDVSASVNHPGTAFGFKLYQNSTGDAARLTVYKDGELLQEQVLCVGERAYLLGTTASVLLRAYLPDFDETAQAGARAGYAYLVYNYDPDTGEERFVTMDVQAEGGDIPVFTPYEVRFSEPRSYTLIQIKRDRFTPVAFLGGLVTLLGLFLAFYLQTRKLWAVREQEGSWTVYAKSPKAGALFADRVRQAAGQMKKDQENS